MKNIEFEGDFFNSKEYLEASLLPHQSVFEFDHSENGQRFITRSICRKIVNLDFKNTAEPKYHDLETNLSYGGYYTTTDDNSFIISSLSSLKKTCLERGIVAQLIRFDPLDNFTTRWEKYLDFFVLDRKTVNIDLTQSRESRWSGYSSTTRNLLRKSASLGKFKILESISEFEVLYVETMNRNSARTEYYYPTSYFEFLQRSKNGIFAAIYSGGKIVSAAVFILSGSRAYYHLSANSSEGLKKGGNYLLMESMSQFLQDNYPHVNVLHLGGGRTNAPDDKLLNFKSKFSNIFANYYVGGKIFNPKVYNYLVNDAEHKIPELINKNYFFKYRLGIQ